MSVRKQKFQRSQVTSSHKFDFSFVNISIGLARNRDTEKQECIARPRQRNLRQFPNNKLVDQKP